MTPKQQPRRTAVPTEFHDHGGASEKQLAFIGKLLSEREAPESWARRYGELVAASELTVVKASEMITALLDRPRKEQAEPTTTGADWKDPKVIPAGHYAIDQIVKSGPEGPTTELRFYHVWRGTRRPEYVKVYVEHGPDDSEVPFRAAVAILQKIIAAGIGECAIRYGREIGACSQCGRRLTNRLSRELAIGPVCGGRVFDSEVWSERKATARAAIIERGEDPNETIADDGYDADVRRAARDGYDWS
jgi:hypothetical protein